MSSINEENLIRLLNHHCKVDELMASPHLSYIGKSAWSTFYRLNSRDKEYFVKLADTPLQVDILNAELQNLKLLAKTETIKIPRLHWSCFTEDQAVLVSDYILEHPTPQAKSYTQAAIALAELHQNHNVTFGASKNNYIGALPQQNTTKTHIAAEHYLYDRILPQANLAAQRKLLSSEEYRRFETLFKLLNELIPEEPPSLIHGDLWQGNFLIHAKDHSPYFIDPASSYSIREMDISMTLLFGGFPALFYNAYNEVFPLTKGWQERVPLFQLYYLLVHLNLFGKTYKQDVMNIVSLYT